MKKLKLFSFILALVFICNGCVRDYAGELEKPNIFHGFSRAYSENYLIQNNFKVSEDKNEDKADDNAKKYCIDKHKNIEIAANGNNETNNLIIFRCTTSNIFNKYGFNKKGINKDTKTNIDKYGFYSNGVNINGTAYDSNGINRHQHYLKDKSNKKPPSN